MKSDNFRALQKRALSDNFVTNNALHAQLCNLFISFRLQQCSAKALLELPFTLSFEIFLPWGG
jgi:hypothetical protein